MHPRVSFITLGVDDLERAVRFYRDGLGLPTKGIVGQQFEHGGVAFFQLRAGVTLALWPRASLAPDAGLPLEAASATEFSLAHNVALKGDVDVVMAQAQAAGAVIVKPGHDTFWGGYAGYFQDPDRHLWEVAWNPRMPNAALEWGEPFSMRAIGTVRSAYHDTADVPKGLGASHEAEGVLDLLPELEPGLADIEGFSHLYVLWAFDRVSGYDLTAAPPSDDRPHGVFATRSPRRPNPIGLTVVRLLRRDGSRLHVHGIDMLDGTPILDIKPYLSSVPSTELQRGWLADAEARARGKNGR